MPVRHVDLAPELIGVTRFRALFYHDGDDGDDSNDVHDDQTGS